MEIPKQIPVWLKPGAWGAVLGAAAVLVVAFGTGWAVTNSSAQEMAERQTEKAVLSSLTPICVAQFKKQVAPRETAMLAALAEEKSWERGDYIAKQGWATMPGSVEPNDEVAAACVDELMKFAEKSES